MSTTAKAILIGVFVLLLLAGVAAGLVRDLASRERAVRDGTVTSVVLAGNDYKTPAPRLTRIDVRLDDGRAVSVSSGNTTLRNLDTGGRVRVAERVTPWGQTWYALVEPTPDQTKAD